MKNLIFLTIISLILTLELTGQNFIYVGDKSYKSTPTWIFTFNGKPIYEKPEIAVAKHENGGYLFVSIRVLLDNYSISGNCKVFLNDGSVLTCTETGIKDNVDNKAIALFNLTSNDIELLKNKRIVKIRFSLKDNTSGKIEDYTCDNKKKIYLSCSYSSEKDYYETDVEIRKLFESDYQ